MKYKIIATCMFLSFLIFTNTNSVSANSNWDNYFAFEESKEIKKMVKKSIIHEFENPEGDWKKLIRGKSIKDGAISAQHLKDGSLLKKTLYTLNVECNKEFADRVETTENSANPVEYYKRVKIEEMNLSNPPSITVYYKRIYEENDSWIYNGWRVSSHSYIIDNGSLWIDYGSENDYSDFGCGAVEYKIVVVN